MSRHQNTEGELRLQTKERLERGSRALPNMEVTTLISSSHLNVLYKGLTQEKPASYCLRDANMRMQIVGSRSEVLCLII